MENYDDDRNAKMYDALHDNLYDMTNIISLVQFIKSYERLFSVKANDFSQDTINDLCIQFYHYLDKDRKSGHISKQCRDGNAKCHRCTIDGYDATSKRIIDGIRNYFEAMIENFENSKQKEK